MFVSDARSYLLQHLPDDDIPVHLFLVNEHDILLGILSVKRLFLASETQQEVTHLMSPIRLSLTLNQMRHDVVTLLNPSCGDLVPVLAQGRVVGVLREKEMMMLVQDEDTEDA